MSEGGADAEAQPGAHAKRALSVPHHDIVAVNAAQHVSEDGLEVLGAGAQQQLGGDTLRVLCLCEEVKHLGGGRQMGRREGSKGVSACDAEQRSAAQRSSPASSPSVLHLPSRLQSSEAWGQASLRAWT